MFQFPPFASVPYARISVLQTDGLSHSEISGSKVICTYPELIAAYHVLHRLCEPRHPPCALSYFLLISHVHRHNSSQKDYRNDVPRDTAHTFSCISCYLLSTVLSCVNMSKISNIYYHKQLRVQGASVSGFFLYRKLLFLLVSSVPSYHFLPIIKIKRQS